ncbi:putative serine/threonine-protein kinase [Capsicum chinense]|nr:putative serine/threonine-protein kinase [Capsicum chinense]
MDRPSNRSFWPENALVASVATFWAMVRRPSLRTLAIRTVYYWERNIYSNVYKVKDLIIGKIVALKKVRFDTFEPESVKFMEREILVLKKLNHPNVIKLEGLVTSRMSLNLWLCHKLDAAQPRLGDGLGTTKPNLNDGQCAAHPSLGNRQCGTYLMAQRQSNGNRGAVGGLGVLLSGTDNKVLAGVVTGMLTAASPVQVVVSQALVSQVPQATV